VLQQDYLEHILSSIATPFGIFRSGRDRHPDFPRISDPFWLQFILKAPDYAQSAPEAPAEWRGRKWRVSVHSTEREVVGTAFAALMMALEHEAREGFKYHGAAIFGPHIPLGSLMEGAMSPPDSRDAPTQFHIVATVAPPKW
jgi:hypothetical protein